MEIKRILGARTSKRLATLLSLGAIALPLVGCTPAESKEVHEDEHKKLDISFCDTSNISAQNYYEGYVKSYADGDTTYIIDQMEDIRKAYEKMTAIPGTFETEPGGITFNFDGTVMPYELKEGVTFYANGERIKEIFMSTVWLKTADGYFKINKDDNSYIIKNCNEKQKIETEITYGEDKSCSIVEHNGGKVATYEFDDNGLLLYSKIIGDGFEEKTYVDGNPDMCSVEKNEKYTKELKKDGSFVIITTNRGMLSERLGYNLLGLSDDFGEIKFYYDRNEKLRHVDARREDYYNGKFIKMIAYPNGKVFYNKEGHDKDGNVISVEKIEQEYDVKKNSIKFETALTKKVDEDGKMHTLVYKDDYTLINPENITRNENWQCDRSYMSRDGVVEIYSKDGFIYTLKQVYNGSEKSEYFEGHKVEGNTVKYADCNGKITRALSDIQDIGYWDYENNVKEYVKNLSENEIEVEFNGNNYLLEKDGSVSCNSDNSIVTYRKNKDFTLTKYLEKGWLEKGWSELHTPGETIRYDADDKIKSISRENYYVSYYDYDKNIIQKISENGISKEFFEDGCSVKLIQNNSCEEPYVYDGYELKIGSRLKYNDNKSLIEYYYDGTKYIKNNGNGDHEEIKENGTLYEYSHFDDHRLIKITQNVDDPDNSIETVYQDYENNIIKSVTDSQKIVYYYSGEPGFEQQIYEIKNISDEPLTVCDAEGKEYILNRDDCITYQRNGHISMLEQGELERRYISKNNSEYYWECPRGKYWSGSVVKVLRYNDEILYEGSMSDVTIGYNKDGDLVKVTTKDGQTIVDLTKPVEQTAMAQQQEETVDIEDEER